MLPFSLHAAFIYTMLFSAFLYPISNLIYSMYTSIDTVTAQNTPPPAVYPSAIVYLIQN